jgi:hypothetical protein
VTQIVSKAVLRVSGILALTRSPTHCRRRAGDVRRDPGGAGRRR